MKLSRVLLTIFVAVTLQVTLARFTVGGRWSFDLVLVGVVYAALLWGPMAGMLAGTLAGLVQDSLAGSIVGVGGLAKTVVGCLSGVVGAQFVLLRPQARTIIVAFASIVHRLGIIALLAIIEQRWSGVDWGAMLSETLINSVAGLILFQAHDAVPGAVSKGRLSRRSSLSRRQW
jgi:rod shape-determining protein MreD